MVTPSRFVQAEAARARFGPSIDRLASLLSVGDPLADAAVDALHDLPRAEGMALVDRAIAKGIADVPNAPPALRALFAELEHVPAWVDHDAIERGGELLFRVGFFGGLALATSLLYGYASPAGNKPLVFSGRLMEQAPRRLVETSRFVEQTCLPGGLSRFSEGWAITVKVRIMHAYIRRMMKASPTWRDDAWGLPANQHDMGATALLFSIVVVDTLRSFGFVFDAEEVHLYMQLWRYSGYLMGVSPEVLPTSELDAKRLAEMVAATEEGPDDDSRKLSRALFATGEEGPPRATERERERARKMVRLGQGLIRGTLGTELADLLDVPKHEYRHAFQPVRALVAAVDGGARRGPAYLWQRYRARGIAQGHAYWRSIVNAPGAPLTFAPPDTLLGKVVKVAEDATRTRKALRAVARPR